VAFGDLHGLRHVVSTRRITVGSVGLAFLLAWATVEFNVRRGGARRVQITCPGGQILRVEFADDARVRGKGLSGRRALESDGMLFQWPTAGTHPIWMRDMWFPLDIVWCDDTGVILAVKQRVPPCELERDCPLYGAGVANARFVLELRASSVAALGLRVGERLHIGLSPSPLIADLHVAFAPRVALVPVSNSLQGLAQQVLQAEHDLWSRNR
jgi:uncharacterized membrane protein (UPF0127 family)